MTNATKKKTTKEKTRSRKMRTVLLRMRTQVFFVVIIYFLALFCIHWLRFIVFIDSNSFCSGRSNRFRRNPIRQVRQRWLRRIRTYSQGSSITWASLSDQNSKFGMFYTNQGVEWENKLLRDRMQHHGLKVTCHTHEHYDIAMAHTSRFGITVIAYLGR